MQRIEHGLGVLLANGLTLIGVQFLNLALDVVNLGKLLQREPGKLAFVGCMQVEELAPRVRQAASFRDAIGKPCLVASEVVADQRSPPVAQEVTRMFAGPGLAEVVDHGLHIFEGAWGVGPEVSPVRRSFARPEHLHRRLVCVQHTAAEYLGLERIDQRLQPHPAGANPLRQSRARNGQTGAGKDGFLPVQRQVVGVLGHQHLGQQAAGGNALVDHMSSHRHLGDALALRAGPLATDVALHREHAGNIVELLGDVFANAFHRTATGAGGGVGLVADLAPGQVGWQRLAFGLLFDLGPSRWGL